MLDKFGPFNKYDYLPQFVEKKADKTKYYQVLCFKHSVVVLFETMIWLQV